MRVCAHVSASNDENSPDGVSVSIRGMLMRPGACLGASSLSIASRAHHGTQTFVADREGAFMQPDGFVSAECALADGCEACLGSSSYTDCGNYVDNRTGKCHKAM